MLKYLPLPDFPVPEPNAKAAYGPVYLHYAADLWDVLQTPLARPMGLFQSPKTFEALHQAYGYVLYCTVIQGHYPSPALLELNNLADRAHLYIDKVRKHEVKIPLDGGLIFLLNYQEFAGILSRTGSLFSMPIQVVHNQSLCILVENQGRFAYGPDIKDFKVNILSFNSMVSAF